KVHNSAEITSWKPPHLYAAIIFAPKMSARPAATTHSAYQHHGELSQSLSPNALLAAIPSSSNWEQIEGNGVHYPIFRLTTNWPHVLLVMTPNKQAQDHSVVAD
ncbi:hypothetical protein JOQ06_000657, partial [Pogonophryne albipinna]